MILYAVKIGVDYLHFDHNGGFDLCGIERTSVFRTLEEARNAAKGIAGAYIVEMELKEKVL